MDTDASTGMSAARCSECECDLSDYGDVGYDGPASTAGGRLVPNPDNTDCSPVMAWLKLCRDCAARYGL